MRLRPSQLLSGPAVGLGLILSGVAPAIANPPPPAPSKPEVDPQAKRITGSENYIPTFGLRASISHGYRVSGVIAVDAGLDVPSAKARKRADALKPRLISDMRDAVLAYASLSYVDGQKPDADMLEIRLQKAVDGVLGPGEARVALASVIVYAK
jgi:hypothetical protein